MFYVCGSKHAREAAAAWLAVNDGVVEVHMQSPNVVLLQGNPEIARSLATALSGSFRVIDVATSLEELRDRVVKHRARVAIVDLEMANMSDVAKLTRELPGACIVCNHRLADEEMWTEALSAGATDVCPSTDICAIVSAARRDRMPAFSAAA
jgi:DNA-binding NarL/FixJ family response regulator